jgi:hypothetical protein
LGHDSGWRGKKPPLKPCRRTSRLPGTQLSFR